jgi:AMP nucleosidase
MLNLSPQAAITRLIDLHNSAVHDLQSALNRYVATRQAPSPAERLQFCYPELRVTYRPEGATPGNARAYAKFQDSGVYTTTITQPAAFQAYLYEQLVPLVEEYGASLEVRLSRQEIPYAYVLDGDELALGDVPTTELARLFPTPHLAAVGDEIADGLWRTQHDEPKPLSLFDAARTDYSLKRLVHYSGTDWQAFQPWILFTNYHRYVDEFVRWAVGELSTNSRYEALIGPGNIVITPQTTQEGIERIAQGPWRRHQMPAYHLKARDGNGITLINIGVGPSNAKTITDHLAVLRPHCWLMIGHCGGLRQSQRIGDYVLAHAYLREDHILDSILPPEIPIPALAEVQVALQQAAAQVTGERGADLKARLRTGTVVTEDDRNWELRWSQESRPITLSRAIAIDMESGTIAAQGYRFRVPYGTLLCVSDKPLHGEIKLPGAANAFYQRAISQHLEIGIKALAYMQQDLESLHSRKLRSFEEPPFR